MALPRRQTTLTNWSKSANSSCYVYSVTDTAQIARALALAQAERMCVIPHGAGHSYTDAALNTGGVVIDVTPMRKILSWDPTYGIMRLEPGVTVGDMMQMAWQDGWWPYVSPSTPEVTIGGCTAMNVNGKNAWKDGPFGDHVLSLDVLLPSGDTCTLSAEQDPQLFQAFVGSLGLLGIITSITVQLQRISSGYVKMRRRRGATLAEVFALFAEEEPRSDFMEAWLDGFAGARQLGRGVLTSAAFSNAPGALKSPFPAPGPSDRWKTALVRQAARLGRLALLPGVQTANRACYGWSGKTTEAQESLIPFTFWPAAAFAGYPALLPEGVETLQAFVPGPQAQETFERVLRRSRQQDCLPIWCTVKKHCHDPFLLSYQVDGFSLECYYPRTRQTAQHLQQVLQSMIAMVVEAGGRFYFAKDHFLTPGQFRQSLGEGAVDTFLQLKQRVDPEMLLQSDLFRRVFWPARQ